MDWRTKHKIRTHWRGYYLTDPPAEEYTKFKFDSPFGSSRKPEWFLREIADREKNPSGEYNVHAISISILSPAGEEHTFKWWLPCKKKVSFEDFARCIRTFEDRHWLYLEKTALVGLVADKIFKEKDLDLNERNYLHRPERFKKRKPADYLGQQMTKEDKTKIKFSSGW